MKYTQDSRLCVCAQVAVQLDTLLPLLTLQPRDLMVAIDGSRSELELQVKKQTTMTGIPPIF
eukprot:COSAG01_NODE_40051_length_468_cov_1.102981_1_plen_61_part_10